MKHRATIAGIRIDVDRYDRIISLRNRLEQLWNLVKTPIKFPAPARRRRSDREIPKAA